MPLPDYNGGSIVNLMSSLMTALGTAPGSYPMLRDLPAAELQRSKNVILLVIDGMGYGFLSDVGSGGLLHSHLRAPMTSVFPPTTATAITTFLTGTAPQQHALTGWHTYLREVGAVTAVLPWRPRLGGLTLSQVGIGADRLLGHVPVFDRIDVDSYVVAPRHIIHSEFNAAHSGRAYRRPFSSLAGLFTTLAGTLDEGGGRKYIYAYYPELDTLAHEFGIGSRQAADHLSVLERALSSFLARIKGSDSTLIVTADHGFIDTDPDHTIYLENHPELARTLLLPLCGEPRTAYCYVHPDRRERFESYVTGRLGEHAALHRSRDLIEQNYFGLGNPDPRLADRVGEYTLIMRGNSVVKDWLAGESRYTHIGVHGGTSESEMLVPLVVIPA